MRQLCHYVSNESPLDKNIKQKVSNRTGYVKRGTPQILHLKVSLLVTGCSSQPVKTAA